MPSPRTPNFSPIQTQKDYRTFLVNDRNKLLAHACARYPDLELGNDIRQWMKEIDELDDYCEKLIEFIRDQQKIERESITAGNYRQLRDTQIKIKGLLRRLKISVEQKAEVNDKIEKFLDDFTANLPIIFAETKRDEEEVQPILVTPEIKAKEIEILKLEKEFAAEEWKIEQSYIQANISQEPAKQKYETEEYDLPPPPSSGRGRRAQIPNPNPSPKKSANRSQASPRRAKKPTTTTPTVMEKEKEQEEPERPPPEKKSRTSVQSNNTSVATPINSPPPIPPTPPIVASVTITPSIIAHTPEPVSGKGGRKRITRKSIEVKTPSTPEEIAAKKEERAKVKKAKEEEKRKKESEAEEIERLTAQLELEGDLPKRRAAATAAAVAIHSAHIHPPKTTPTTSKTASNEKETTISGNSGSVGGGRKRSNSKKEKSNKQDTEEEETYCICKEISYGDMIACDNEDCTIIWFHFSCVGLKIKPKRGLNWYCHDCRGEKSSVLKKK